MRARAFLWGWILVVALAGPASAQQDGPHRAGLVVVHGDGRVLTSCVSFNEQSISGTDLLRRSGLALVLSAYGGMGYGVCAIDGEGCQEGESCFCQCESSPCAYWVYSHRRPDGTWAVSGMGANGWKVADGDVDAWVWGDGSEAPPRVDFAAVCPDEPPTPQPGAEELPGEAGSASVEAGGVATQPPSRATPPVPTVPLADTALPASSSRPLTGYIVFGAIALGLVAVMVFGRRRQR